jgi:hypothetical protein
MCDHGHALGCCATAMAPRVWYMHSYLDSTMREASDLSSSAHGGGPDIARSLDESLFHE